MMIRHFRILVSGKVHGVFFRASAKEQADALGLKGTIQNLPGGQVRIEAEGEDEMLQFFVSWCKQGPKLAQVSEVLVTTGDLNGYSNFSILR